MSKEIERSVFGRLVVKTDGRSVLLRFCRLRDHRDHTPFCREDRYRTMAEAIPHINRWYEAKNAGTTAPRKPELDERGGSPPGNAGQDRPQSGGGAGHV